MAAVELSRGSGLFGHQHRSEAGKRDQKLDHSLQHHAVDMNARRREQRAETGISRRLIEASQRKARNFKRDLPSHRHEFTGSFAAARSRRRGMVNEPRRRCVARRVQN